MHARGITPRMGRTCFRQIRIWTIAAVFLVAWCADMGLFASPALAGAGTTIQVPAQCSLVNAMQAAQDNNASNECGTGAMTGPYTIVLDPSHGPYELTSVNNYVDGPNGLPDVTGTVTVESSSSIMAIIQRSTAAGTPAFRFFHVSAPQVQNASGTVQPGVPGVSTQGNLTLNNILLEDGLAQGGAGGASVYGGGGGLGAGGAIFSHGGAVTVENSTIDDNTAQGGAGAGTSSSSSAYGGGGGGAMGGNGGQASPKGGYRLSSSSY